MSLHAVVAGWLLGSPSGANRRLLALLGSVGDLLAPGERVTVLHRPEFRPPASGSAVAWRPIDVPAGPALRRSLAERRMLAPALRTLGATVYDHGFLPLPTVPVAACLTVHDVRAVDGLTRWPRVVARAALRRSCARADAVLTPSAWTRARLAALGVTNAFVVPNAVEPPGPGPFTPARRLPERGYLLHVGHLEPRKNLGVVLGALARLPDGRRPELWLAGHDAGAGPALRAEARRLGVDGSLHLLGRVDDAALHALYAHAAAVVLPSRHEGFGLAALEALAHGRPVLAADAAALPEVGGAAVTLLSADDPAAWATALGHIDDSRAACDRRRAYAAAFRWRDSAARLVDVWRRLSDARR